MCLFFFFRQKTAYEMRISDWSSDVCSSDLVLAGPPLVEPLGLAEPVGHPGVERRDAEGVGPLLLVVGATEAGGVLQGRTVQDPLREEALRGGHLGEGLRGDRVARSEEHTSELQSPMRISYAVFCLKKK